MTVAEIMQQAQTLSPQERKELVKLLIDSLEIINPAEVEAPRPKTGVEIAAMLDEIEPIELVDPEITDPAEWVKVQRRKESDRLTSYWEDQ
jgi:hypothetical protein